MSDSNNFKIGKKTLVTLTTGMYSNPLFLYREYIQNAADAIDEAINNKILNCKDAQIIINIDADNRIVTIKDNATGITAQKARALLGNIGDSKKNYRENKGFIGIGRLGGLGYCRRMIFETSAFGEEVETVFEWDAERLQQIISDDENDDDIESVLKAITKVSPRGCKKGNHYFKVTLEGINENHNELLDIDNVREYIEMVAPVDFDYTKFHFKKNIHDYVKREGLPAICEYAITLNDEDIKKGYSINVNPKSNTSDIDDVDFRILKDDKTGAVIAWLWFGVGKYEGVIPSKILTRGLRLRKNNIQIGEAECLSGNKFWAEPRGNHYFIGEVYVVDPELKPNARRDYFIIDEPCRRFERLLKDVFKELTLLYRKSSEIRSAYNQIESSIQTKKEYENRRKKGYIDKKEKVSSEKVVKDADEKEINARKKLDRLFDDKGYSASNTTLKKVFSAYKEQKEQIGSYKGVQVPKTGVNDAYAVDNMTDSEKVIIRIVEDELKKNLAPKDAEFIINKIYDRIRKRLS